MCSLLARVVVGAAIGAGVTLCAATIGADIRGDTWGEEPARDLAAGLGVLGAVVAVKWAVDELEGADSDR